MTSYTSAPHVLVIETPGLGNRGYIAHDGQSAVVIDPQRDIDRVEHLLAEHGLQVTHVCETHVHNDYVSGGVELAARHGAAYLIPGEAGVPFAHTPVNDGDVFASGALQLTVMSTPGHTPHHVSYVVAAAGHEANGHEANGHGSNGAVFSGGSMLYGAVGRPDLVTPELTEPLAHDQWHSVRRIASDLDDRTHVYPTHGFGSFCAATQNDGVAGVIADERATNPALLNDERAFVDETLAGLDVFPAYYAHMGPANSRAEGPPRVDLSRPCAANPQQIRERIAAGEWVIDLRSREVFAVGHLPGTLSFDLDGAFVAYVGWLIPWGAPVTLLGETTEQIEAAQRELVRIGIDRPVAQAVGGPDFWADDSESLESTERVTFAEVAEVHAAHPDTHLLDVRQQLEWDESHVRGAQHIPFYEIPDRVDEIPRDRPVYVTCGSGYRAAAVTSLLRSGLVAEGESFDNLVLVDDDWTSALDTSLPIEAETSESDGPVQRPAGWTWRASRRTARVWSGSSQSEARGQTRAAPDDRVA